MMLGLPWESFLVLIVLPALVVGVMIVHSFVSKDE